MNKYHAKPTSLPDGSRYDSRAEAARSTQLDLLWRAGHIQRYRHQPTYHLGCPENTYRADFEVVDANGEVHAEDVKGFRTQKCRRDIRLWRRYGPCPLYLLTRKNHRWITEIIPGGQP